MALRALLLTFSVVLPVAFGGEKVEAGNRKIPVIDTAAVFAPTSFWYVPIPADAPLHRNSANFVADFLRQKKAYYGTVNINTTEYASPVFVADEKHPPFA